MRSPPSNPAQRQVRRNVLKIDRLLQDGAYELAIEHCEQLLDRDPDNPKLLGRLGLAHRLANRPDRAFYYFGRAAQSFATLKDAKGARVMLLEADRLRPKDPTILFLLAKCLQHEDNTAEYVSTLHRLVQATRGSQDGREDWARSELSRLGEDGSASGKAEGPPNGTVPDVPVVKTRPSKDEEFSEVEVTVRAASWQDFETEGPFSAVDFDSAPLRSVPLAEPLPDKGLLRSQEATVLLRNAKGRYVTALAKPEPPSRTLDRPATPESERRSSPAVVQPVEGNAPKKAQPKRQTMALLAVLGFVVLSIGGAWLAATQIESPADVAARAAPPPRSPILVPVERRILRSTLVTRGTARFGLPQLVSVVPSTLKAGEGLVTTLPKPNAQIEEGEVILTASGRPLFVLQGKVPAFRDLTPGTTGDDVRQLEEGLKRIGFSPGRIDGTYDKRTADAVAKWYSKAGWEPFGPTRTQQSELYRLEAELHDAIKLKRAAEDSMATARLAVKFARAAASLEKLGASSALSEASEKGDGRTKADRLAVEAERAKAAHAITAAEAEVAERAAERSRVVLDPRQPKSAQKAAEARLDLAKTAAKKTKLEGKLAVKAAERQAQLAAQRLERARAEVRRAELSGQRSIRAAENASKLAQLEARLARPRVARLAEEVSLLRRRLGVQIPLDEIVFLPALPVRVEEVKAQIGDPAKGPVMSVTDNELVVDSALPLDAATFVKPGMKVKIDEPTVGIEAIGEISQLAARPGTKGVDAYHVYFEVKVVESKSPLAGFSVRLTIPVESTKGEVTVVPLSALSLAADGTSRVQVQTPKTPNTPTGMTHVVVKPGLSADGFVEVTPIDGSLEPGQLVVVGYENSES